MNRDRPGTRYQTLKATSTPRRTDADTAPEAIARDNKARNIWDGLEAKYANDKLGPMDLWAAACNNLKFATLFDEQDDTEQDVNYTRRFHYARALCDECPMQRMCRLKVEAQPPHLQTGIWAGRPYGNAPDDVKDEFLK